MGIPPESTLIFAGETAPGKAGLQGRVKSNERGRDTHERCRVEVSRP